MSNPSILIIPTVAYILCAVAAVRRSLVCKKQIAALGACILVLPRKKSFAVIGICAFCALLLAFLYVRSFNLIVTLAFALCAVMAVDMSIGEALLKLRAGVYENGLVSSGKLLFKTDVAAFPQFAYEQSEEPQLIPSNVIQAVTANGITSIVFETREDRDAAAVLLKKWILT